MKALGIIFSNIHDKEIRPLTSERTLASVPFAGRYRLIDFALSNMVNSRIAKVGVITKDHYQSLMDHVGNGKSWDLARKKGGLILLPPFAVNQTNLYKNRFEALCQARQFLAKAQEEFVIMSDCDSVCNLDYTPILRRHIDNAADITVVYSKKNTSSSRVSTVFNLDKSSRVVSCGVNSNPKGKQLVFTNMIVLGRKFLLNLIDNRANLGYKSFSKDILTKVDEYKIFGVETTGYYQQIEDIESYYNISMQLLDIKTRQKLFYKNGNSIYTKLRDSAPMRLTDTASIKNSLIADGCLVEGTVENSILFRGCRIKKGAIVKNSILFQDSIVSEDSSLNCVITDKETTILERRCLSGHNTYPQYIAKGLTI